MINKIVTIILVLLLVISCGDKATDGIVTEGIDFGTVIPIDTIKVEYDVEYSETARLENDVVYFEFSPKPGDLNYFINNSPVDEKIYKTNIADLGSKLLIQIVPNANTTEGDKEFKIIIYSKTIDEIFVDGKTTTEFDLNITFDFNIPYPIWLTILVWVGTIISVIYSTWLLIRKKIFLYFERGTLKFLKPIIKTINLKNKSKFNFNKISKNFNGINIETFHEIIDISKPKNKRIRAKLSINNAWKLTVDNIEKNESFYLLKNNEELKIISKKNNGEVVFTFIDSKLITNNN